jgi:hypothetical protein
MVCGCSSPGAAAGVTVWAKAAVPPVLMMTDRRDASVLIFMMGLRVDVGW